MRTKTIGCMATFPARQATLGQVLDSVCRQLDAVYVYLNGYEKTPDCLQGRSNVTPILGSAAFGDIKANGKMCWLEREREGIVFTLDDDIIYPPNYVQAMLGVLGTFDGAACLAVHGSLFNADCAYYFERQAWFPLSRGFGGNNVINLVGSGTTAFPASLYADVDFAMTGQVFVDLHISLTALRKGLPIVAVARPKNWLEPLRLPGLWEENKARMSHHTALAHAHAALLSPAHLRGLWADWLRQRHIPLAIAHERLNLSPASQDFLAGQEMLIRNAEFSQLRKLMEFAQNLAASGGK